MTATIVKTLGVWLYLMALSWPGVDGLDVCVTPGQPALGQFGTHVTIQGTNLLGAAGGTDIVEVSLAGQKAS